MAENEDGERMTCREVNGFLADYRSGELLPEVRDRLEAHLLRCPTCVAYLRSYDEAIRLARDSADALDDRLLPSDVPAELVEAILARTTRRDGSCQ